MIALHSLLPDLAARETRYVAIGLAPDSSASRLPPDEYAFLEFYRLCSRRNPFAAGAGLDTTFWKASSFERFVTACHWGAARFVADSN